MAPTQAIATALIDAHLRVRRVRPDNVGNAAPRMPGRGSERCGVFIGAIVRKLSLLQPETF
jgi:hypothetical protein